MLVAYATKNWSTAQIARTITQVLRNEGLEAEMRLVSEAGDVQTYDAVILGSPLYEGWWLKDAHRFLKDQGEALRARPVWLFSSGPLDDSARGGDIPPVPEVQHSFIRINARDHVTFGGCLQEGARGWVAQTLVSSGKCGDFRDFEQISAWARGIATALVNKATDLPKGYATGMPTLPFGTPTRGRWWSLRRRSEVRTPVGGGVRRRA
ncbi:menaquinone-dependent protoporphyrinogen oxidase [Streptomyces sp. SLBN-118]|uniref:flavodoxin domain-containing protein n=1 Tax=Streptomyces sp. SLBN-118 TaxID=2768454 RepID=UPI00116D9B6E|nr:flavodoxin domain-containing protein [Streptomyces sp. SLBN-118]TQK42512.1 menaquinone-dependent protoporphyrinogen oxidase [Streptomyces sp. SLBN-118]